MSGPYDRADDPDDVTLWAGRLRAWPTPPRSDVDGDDEVDDDTIVSPRPAPADDTVRVDRADPVDDTVISARPAPADDTVVSARATPVDDPAVSAFPEVDDETAPRRRPSDPSEPEPGILPSDETAPGRRRSRPEVAGPGIPPTDTTSTGDTAAGERRARSRPRVSTAGLPSGDPVPSAREARVPSAADHELYRPRADEAVRVARSAPAARAEDAPDAAAVHPRAPRRGRGRGVALAVAVVLIVMGAAITLFLLMG
ncbi:hypothetical protein [Microbacterium mcarthurae (nom. nud.)]|uniref:Uncharacterized protein n=1 Tax=Microbacterium mcarthurae TaxID=3035918 RepID=A0ABW9GI14_9MICO